MPKIKGSNIFSKLPAVKDREIFQTLARGKGFKIERIVSKGQATPKGQWLCSKADEWVTVLRGRARLRFKEALGDKELDVGDSLFIPAKAKHRVTWTDPRQKTVWLAVHIMRERKR